jgi:beta-N-acetylhexosaminidase
VNATRELAREIIMAGITGTSVDPGLPRFGGYVLFPEDTPLNKVRALTDALRTRSDRPAPLIAIDQEGGRVVRLREGVEPIPSMMALGAADDLELTQRAGEQVALDLRRAGCTLDFAPALDLALEPFNAVIGTRSFSSDPRQVASLGAAFARGLRSGGILPCYKHFPGHGATSVDSHEALPVLDADAATLRARDLVPFAAVARDAVAMMTAHVLVRALDAQRPATLSRRIAGDLLRGELGFGGLLVTDCLEMKAVAGVGSVESAVEALAAGADLLLFSHDVELATAAAIAIEKAVDLGSIPFERLAEARARVAALRAAAAEPLALDSPPVHPGVGREIGRRAITLVRGLPHVDPVATVAVSFGGNEPLLRREAPALDELLVPIDPSSTEANAILEALEERDRRPLLLARRAHHYRGQAEAIARILDSYRDALVVSLADPFDVPLFTKARHVVAAYGDDLASIGGLADVIFGGSMPTGQIPIAE